VRAPEARAASAKAVLAAAWSQASRQAQVPVPRTRPANAVPADADRPAPTMAQPHVPCLLGQNLIPRCPAVQFLVGRSYSSARYLAALSPANRSRAGPGLAAGYPARCRPGRCPAARIPALRSAGRASIPPNTARIPAAARAQPNRKDPVPYRAASPYPASPQTSALWMGSPEMTGLQKGSPPPGHPTAAGLRTVYPGATEARTSGPGTAAPAPGALMPTGRLRRGLPAAIPGPWWRARVASTRTALARTALSQTGPLRAVASAASDPEHRPQARHSPERGDRLPRTAPHRKMASAAG
jgi:hypothetical protein